MLSTQVFNSFAYRPQNGVIKFLALSAFIGGGYGFYWHQSRSASLKQLYDKVENDITEWKPITISGKDARFYPWGYNASLKNWEYKLVKMYGYFRDERFFVRREREDKDGYLVFAPFVTSIYNPHHQQDPERVTKSQVMVNLGWVPIENISDIQMGQEPLGTLTFEDLQHNEITNQFTGFNRNIEQLEEDFQMPYVEVTGLVRRGEEQNILKGRRNWPKEGVYNFIDLWLMSRLYRSFNLKDSSIAYIERVVPEYDEESESLYPIPASKDNYDKSAATPSQHQAYSTLYGLSSVVGMALWLLRR